jgi:predicted deacetylase
MPSILVLMKRSRTLQEEMKEVITLPAQVSDKQMALLVVPDSADQTNCSSSFSFCGCVCHHCV